MTTAIKHIAALESRRTASMARIRESQSNAAQVMTGSFGGSLFGNSGVNIQHAQEQYKHVTGWPGAAISLIAKTIAGQAVRVGVLKKLDTMSKAARRRHRARYIERRLSLPDCFKSYAEELDLLDDHPFLDAVYRPNPLMVQWMLLFVTIVSLEATGRAYWWIYENTERDSEWDQPYTIWPLPSHWAEPRHNTSLGMKGLYAEWKVSPPGGIPMPVPGNQIAQIFYPDASNPMGAMSPLQMQAKAIVADEAISEAQRRGFSNGIMPGYGIVIGRHPDAKLGAGERPALTADQRKQLENWILTAYRGAANNDRPIIMDALIENVIKLTNTPREMEFQRSGEYTKERITQGFTVNPIAMGQVESVSRASSAAAQDHMALFCINPKITLVSQCLTAWVAPKFMKGQQAKRQELIAYIEPLRASDPDAIRADFTAGASAGCVTKDEFRQHVLNLGPLPEGMGGDELAGPAPAPMMPSFDLGGGEDPFAKIDAREEEEETEGPDADNPDGDEEEGETGAKSGRSFRRDREALRRFRSLRQKL